MGGTAGATPTAGAATPGGSLSVGQAAALIGVSASTLRTWQRRYGIAPSRRSAGGHRRYTPQDLAVLERMHALTVAGQTPAHAAVLALSGGGPTSRAPADPARHPLGTTPRDGVRRAGAGGRVLAVPGAGPLAQGLARAASRLDADSVVEILEESLTAHGVEVTYDQLLRPVLVAAGEAWARTGRGIDVEHLFSEAAIEALRHYRRPLRQSLAPGPPVLLACAPQDHHVLPLHVLATALAERTVPTRLLGSRVPASALSAAVLRTGARRVFVWAQMPADGLADVVAALPTRRPPVEAVAGGPGWADVPLPGHVRRPTTLGQAVSALAD